MSRLPLDGVAAGSKRRLWFKVVVYLLVGALAASFWLILCLIRMGYRFEQGTEAVRLDPGGNKTYASERQQPQSSAPLLVFFGDSRALMWSAPGGLPKYRIINRGIGYQTTAQMLLRLDDDVVRLDPAVVILEGGVNDLKAIAAFPERRAEIVADCKANLRRIVDGCRRGGATVVVVTIFEIGEVALWRRPFWSNEVASAVREVNAFLPTLAAPKVVLFDADVVIGDGRGSIRQAYQLDHLHLSPAGYAALNRSLVPLVSALAP